MESVKTTDLTWMDVLFFISLAFEIATMVISTYAYIDHMREADMDVNTSKEEAELETDELRLMKVLKIHKISTGDKIGRYVYIPSFLIVIICYVSYYVPDDFSEYRESIMSILIAFLVTYIMIQGYNTRDNPHGSPDAPTQHAVSYEN